MTAKMVATPDNVRDLGPYLEAVFLEHHRFERLAHDPLAFVHRYESPEDQEVVGLVAALLAYGRVAGILSSVGTVLAVLGDRPRDALERLERRELRAGLAGFVHRWSRAEDLVGLLSATRDALRRWGSLEALFLEGYSPGSPDAVRTALSRLARTLRGLAPRGPARERGLPFLLPDAAAGSACKRLNLYLRWMVRRDDPLDRGIWRRVSPADLIIPLDTHVARIARNLGLSARRTADWKMAEEVTAGLRAIDPADPTRFDFSICRLGILSECPTRRDVAKCLACELRPVCRLHATLSGARGAVGRAAARRTVASPRP